MKSARTQRALVAPISWNDLPWGRHYLSALESQLQPLWRKIVGIQLVKLGQLSLEMNIEDCIIPHQFSVGKETAFFSQETEPYRLPFSDNSFDACLSALLLSYSDEPHWLLHEIDRVLIDDGWIILAEFSPLSIIGMGKCCPFLRSKHPFCSHLFSSLRILDWLSVLNYEVIYHHRVQCLPWCQKMQWINTYFSLFGSLTVIVARKRTYPLTPTSLRYQFCRPSLAGMVGAAQRSSCRC